MLFKRKNKAFYLLREVVCDYFSGNILNFQGRKISGT